MTLSANMAGQLDEARILPDTIAACTVDTLWGTFEKPLQAFDPDECSDCFRQARYGPN